MIKQAYINGFTRRCIELGVDPRYLLKLAQEQQELPEPDVSQEQIAPGDLPGKQPATSFKTEKVPKPYTPDVGLGYSPEDAQKIMGNMMKEHGMTSFSL